MATPFDKTQFDKQKMINGDGSRLIPPMTSGNSPAPLFGASREALVLSQVLGAIAQFRIYFPPNASSSVASSASLHWQCEYCSPGCEAVLGYSPDVLMRDPELWRSRIHPDDWQLLLSLGYRSLSHTGVWTGELRFYNLAGDERWLLVNSQALPLLEEGRAIALAQPESAAPSPALPMEQPQGSAEGNSATAWLLTVVATDVTALKQVQRVHQQSQHQFQQVVENSPNAIFSVNAEGKLLTWNHACTQFFGYGTAVCGQLLWGLLVGDDQRQAIAHHLAKAFAGETLTNLEMTYRCLDGSWRITLSRLYPVTDEQGTVTTCVFANTDITERKQRENQIRQREFSLRRAQQLAQIGDWTLEIATQLITGSEESARILELDLDRTLPLPLATLLGKIHPEDRETVRAMLAEAIHNAAPFNLEVRLVRQMSSTLCYVALNGQVEVDAAGQGVRLFGTVQDITVRQQAELFQRHQAQRNQIMLHLTQRVRRSLKIDEILDTTVIEVRQLLRADRVTVYRFNPDWSGVFMVEAVKHPDLAILGLVYDDPCFRERYIESYGKGRICAIDNVETAAIADCHRTLLQQFNVRANLVVPILQGESLWGLLIVHECYAPRQWQTWEQELLQQLSIQVGIALQQSELYKRVQALNADLEEQVQRRTERLERSASFEILLKGITDKVRDTLDEQTILKKVVEELTRELHVSSCDTGVYDLDQQISMIQQECLAPGMAPALRRLIPMQDHAEIYQQLLNGQTLHFCWLRSHIPEKASRIIDQNYSVLACPLIDDQGVIGDMWLYRASGEAFDELEMRLVEQIANQCAIAIRQARLYQESQTQIHKLEQLNKLKDEFLSSVSHELRTPMANIKMATQMLEVNLSQHHRGGRSANDNFDRYFRILKDECHRELKLINDLLDLSRLDAETEPLLPSTINLRDWLEHLVEPYVLRMRNQEQSFVCNLPDTLPDLTCDFTYLGRIIGELLNNACKYTPVEETIQLCVQQGLDHIRIQIRNSGIEIPLAEQARVFDRFYRIPSTDPWKHEGTGLGLALVQKLAERLGSTVSLESGDNWTTFSVYIFPDLLAERIRLSQEAIAEENASADSYSA